MDDPSQKSREGVGSKGLEEDIENGSLPSTHDSTHKKKKPDNTPDKKLTLIVIRLAVLQKISTGLATQGFIWATVVLLGGFVSELHSIDFIFVTAIILTESARIFSRSHELQWTLESPWAMSDANAPTPEDEISYVNWLLLSRNFSYVFYFLQLLSASSCATLSVVRFVQLSNDSTYPDTRNMRTALYVFYGLAFVEASLSLLEKAYAAWIIHLSRLLKEVNEDYDLGPRGMVAIKRFFNVTYLHCFKGSIFDGLNHDLVSFATKLLASDDSRKQRLGALVLEKLVTKPEFSKDTIGNIGTSKSVIETLVYLLRSECPETNKSVAKIVAKLAAEKQSSPLIAAIPGAIEHVSSLLDNERSLDRGIGKKNYEDKLGLKILEQLSRDYNNRQQMARTIDLWPNILRALEREDPELRMESARIVSRLCPVLSKDRFVQVPGGVSAVASKVRKAIVLSAARNKEEVEVLLELAKQLFTSMSKEEAIVALNPNGVDEVNLSVKLLEILKFNPSPSTKRLAIELAISTMQKDEAMAPTFRNIGMEPELKNLDATTSEIESSLIRDALKLMAS